MKTLLSFFTFMLIAFAACAQVVECSPEFPTAFSDNVVITFHADKGTAGLKGFSGDVYVHTGVIMKNSSEWTKVKADWGVNLPACKLTRTASNTYTLSIGSIKDFYGLTEAEAANVAKLAMVFRSSDGKKEGKADGGKDIFLQVYEPNHFDIVVKSPANPFFAQANQSINIEVSTSETCDITYAIDGGDPAALAGTSLELTAAESGVHTVVFSAEKDGKSGTATFSYVVVKDAEVAQMPQGLRRGANVAANGDVTFVLYAPKKRSAYVVGDFSGWTIGAESAMKRDGDYFFATISGLEANREYAYQYIVDETIKIADPYTEKILDPDNDKYIQPSIYPNLKYPEGKTSGIVSTFNTGKRAYSFKNQFDAPKAENLVIYELLIRDFTADGSIKAVEAQLDYLSELGINAIELLPFSEFEGNDSWGYNPSFYFAADKAYGTPDDYKSFIDECHARGIAVIQDIVLNHSFSQSPFVQLYINQATSKVTSDNPWYNVESPNTAYSWGYDFNHESPETQLLVDSIMAYWIKEYNVDGYRFDFTKGFTNTRGDGQAYDASRIKILERIYDKITSLKPNAYMICEHLADSKEEKELSEYGIMLWKNINYQFCQSAMGFATDCSTNAVYHKSIGYPKNNVVAYAESHDEERMGFKCSEYGNVTTSHNVKDKATYLQRLKGAAAILLSTPGPKMIWQFGEIGYDYSINYRMDIGGVDPKDPESGRTARKPIITGAMDDPQRASLYKTYAALCKLRSTSDAMINGDVDINSTKLFKTVYRTSDKACVVVAANMGVEPATQTLKFARTGTYYDILTGEEFVVSASEVSMTFEPGQTRVLSDKKEDIAMATGDIDTPAFANVSVYPNPTADFCNISADEISEVRIFNAAGVLVSTFSNIKANNFRINLSDLRAGLYMLAIKVGGQTVVSKIIKE